MTGQTMERLHSVSYPLSITSRLRHLMDLCGHSSQVPSKITRIISMWILLTRWVSLQFWISRRRPAHTSLGLLLLCKQDLLALWPPRVSQPLDKRLFILKNSSLLHTCKQEMMTSEWSPQLSASLPPRKLITKQLMRHPERPSLERLNPTL